MQRWECAYGAWHQSLWVLYVSLIIQWLYFLPLLRGKPCPLDTHVQIGLRLLQHFSGWGWIYMVGMGAASGRFPFMSTLLMRWRGGCWAIVFTPYNLIHLTWLNPISTEGQVCVCSTKATLFFNTFRVMIDRVIVCACETAYALERQHSSAVGRVNMWEVFLAVESSRKSNIKGCNNNFVFSFWKVHYTGHLLRICHPCYKNFLHVAPTDSMLKESGVHCVRLRLIGDMQFV